MTVIRFRMTHSKQCIHFEYARHSVGCEVCSKFQIQSKHVAVNATHASVSPQWFQNTDIW